MIISFSCSVKQDFGLSWTTRQKELTTNNIKSGHKEARTENESAIERLRTDFEKFRTTIEGNSKTLIFQTVGVFAAIAGIVGLLIKVFGS